MNTMGLVWVRMRVRLYSIPVWKLHKPIEAGLTVQVPIGFRVEKKSFVPYACFPEHSSQGGPQQCPGSTQ